MCGAPDFGCLRIIDTGRIKYPIYRHIGLLEMSCTQLSDVHPHEEKLGDLLMMRVTNLETRREFQSLSLWNIFTVTGRVKSIARSTPALTIPSKLSLFGGLSVVRLCSR